LKTRVLAKSLAEWTTIVHRANAHTSLVFHAEDLRPAIDASIAEADAFIDNVERSIGCEPQPYRGHPYWQGAMAAFRDATGQRLSEEEWKYLLGIPPSTSWLNEWMLWRAKNAVLGRIPRVFPWHPAWADFHLVLQQLEAFFADQGKRLLIMSNA